MPQNILLWAVTSRIAALQAYPVEQSASGRSIPLFPTKRIRIVEITLPVWLRNRESTKKTEPKSGRCLIFAVDVVRMEMNFGINNVKCRDTTPGVNDTIEA